MQQPEPAAGRTPVLYVAGVPRSGSTLADMMIGQLPGHVGVGELFYLWSNGPGRDVTCACGQVFSACPFWTEVGRRAYGGWDAAPVEEVLALQRDVDRTARIPLVLAGPLAPGFRRRARRYVQLLEQLYAAIAEVSGARVVVDSSKRPSLAFLLRDSRRVQLKVVQVVRDPRGVANSWRKVVALPAGASRRSEMPVWSTRTAVRRWVTVNATVAALSRAGVERTVVRYEDLVREPERSLTQVAGLHGGELGPGDLDFLTPAGVTTASSHTIAGSRIRLHEGPMRLTVDDAWRRELPPWPRRLVSAGTWASRRRYGYAGGAETGRADAGGSGLARAGAAPPPVRVLYIAGMPRSGSTLLDLMLGQVPGHCDVGELFYVFRTGVQKDLLCACGQHFSACPFWTEVGQKAFGGWDPALVEHLLELQDDVDRTSRIPALLAGRLLPAFSRRAAEYGDAMVTLYRAIAEVSGAGVVVDSTKRPSLSVLLARRPDVDLRQVHVVRDPRGVVFSWTKAVEVPAGAGPRARMRTRSPVQITRRWLTVNLMAGAVGRAVPSTRVRYEDLVEDPRGALTEILRVSAPEQPVGPETLAFLGDDGLHLGSSHTVAGGRIRMRTGIMPLRLDDAWRTGLAGARRRAVDVVTGPLRRRYGYR